MALFIPTYNNPGKKMDLSDKHWRWIAEFKGEWIWESWIPKKGE